MENNKLEKLKIKKLDEKIWVFNKWIENPEEYIEYYTKDPINTDRWVPWYTFGDMISDSGTGWGVSKNFPEKLEWFDNYKDEPDPYKRELANLFYDASKIYIEETGVQLPNWQSPNWGIARYFPNVADFEVEHNQGRTMLHHTDFQQEFRDYPGEKFGVTAVVYLNDDYEGGEINFRVTDPEDSSIVVKNIIYKPEPGDILMFPSKPPYYHGVMNVKNNPKYIIRLYWKYEQEASEDWIRLKEKYGESFEELERIRRKRQDMTLADPVLRPRMSMAEYYRLMESGELKEDYHT